MKKCVITNYKDKQLMMLFENNRETAIELYSEESILGNIYVGRVKDLVPNINVAFVEIASDFPCYFSLTENAKPIFLNRKNTEKVCQGDLLLVQVAKEAVKTKAPVVSCNISFAGRYVAVKADGAGTIGVSKKITSKQRISRLKDLAAPYVSDRYGLIIRTEAENVSDTLIIDEIKSISAEYEEMVRIAATRKAFTCVRRTGTGMVKDIEDMNLSYDDEIVTDIPEIYDMLQESIPDLNIRLYDDKLLPLYKAYSIESRIEDALKPRVWLKSGGYLIIEPTEALTVIDVNTGKFDGNEKEREETFMKINLEAATEIARQLKLRNISGIILIDFINMHNDDNVKKLTKTLADVLRNDKVNTKFVDMTKLGLAEVTRQKIKKPLWEAVNENF